MLKSNDLTQERLKAVLKYDPESGVFFWLKSGKGRLPTLIAGTIAKIGYRYIQVDKRFYLAHRLAWLYVYGEWPPEQIDHINGIRSDNRLSNLRCVNNSQNNMNRPAQKNNKSGLKGVSFVGGSYYIAQIGFKKRNHYLGCFKTAEEAHAAYAKAASELFRKYNHSSIPGGLSSRALSK